jgi:hypothetical protein
MIPRLTHFQCVVLHVRSLTSSFIFHFIYQPMISSVLYIISEIHSSYHHDSFPVSLSFVRRVGSTWSLYSAVWRVQDDQCNSHESSFCMSRHAHESVDSFFERSALNLRHTMMSISRPPSIYFLIDLCGIVRSQYEIQSSPRPLHYPLCHWLSLAAKSIRPRHKLSS